MPAPSGCLRNLEHTHRMQNSDTMYALFSANPNCTLRSEVKLSRGQDQIWGSKKEVSGHQKGMQFYLGDEHV